MNPPLSPTDERHARTVLSRFALEPCDFTFTVATGGFSGALVLAVREQYEELPRYCLRRWTIDSMRKTPVRGLHRFIGYLASAGVDIVALPMTTNDGDSLIQHPGQWWQCEPWMPGAADFWQHPSDGRLREAMRRLAEVHAVAATYQPDAASETWFLPTPAAVSPAVFERLRLIKGYLNSAAKPQAGSGELHDLSLRILSAFHTHAASVEAELIALCRTEFPLHPCLRDVWHDHLLFEGDRLTGLIDLSATATENVTTDLSRLLGSLCGDDTAMWRTALDEYESHRPLSLDEHRLLRALDRSGVLLSGMTWVNRILLDPQPIPNPQAVLARLHRIVARLNAW